MTPPPRLKSARSAWLALVWVFYCSASWSSFAADPEGLPPGVALGESARRGPTLPIGVAIHALEVDWTDPMLRAEMAGSGGRSARGVASRWRDLVNEDPDRLLIQLAEPGSEQESASRADDDRVLIGAVAPWAYAGPSFDRAMGINSPISDAQAQIGVRWLGQADEWATRTPEAELKAKWLMSSLDPTTGMGRFLILLNQTGRPVGAEILNEWMRSAFGPDDWIALHSVGDQARVGLGDWRLGGRPTSGALERAGRVLALRSVRLGEIVDWAKIRKPRIQASSSVALHEARNLVSGLLWPAPLRPPVWMSRFDDPERAKTAWARIEFPSPVPVDRVRIVFPSAVGWTPHFDPAALTFTLESRGRPEIVNWASREDPADGAGPVISIPIDAGRLSRLRIDVTEPNRFNLPGPARLAAVQVLGPWDGR